MSAKSVIFCDEVVFHSSTQDTLRFTLKQMGGCVRQKVLSVSKKSRSYSNLLKCTGRTEDEISRLERGQAVGKAAFCLRLVETPTYSYYIRVDFLPSVW